MIETTGQERSMEDVGKTRAVVRQIAAAFRQVEDFEPFVQGLEAALGKAEFFDRAAISLFPRLEEGKESESQLFLPATLCLPLAGQERVNGVVSFSSERHEFGPDDLHLMAGLGDLLAVLVNHALQFGEQRRNLALLGFLLNQMPVGVVCFGRDRHILVSNTLGRNLLGLKSGEGQAWIVPEEWAKEAGASAEFHRRIADQLLHVQVKATSSGSGEEVTALVLADLTSDQEKFHEALARETYRCGWLGRPISLAIVSAENPGGLMALLRPLRERFGPAVIVGPCDSGTIGILFPDTTQAQAMEKLRSVRSRLKSDWEGGVAASSEGEGNPEALFAAAAAARSRVGDFLKHSLLLHDDYASVNDMLEMMLRDDFRVLKSSSIDTTMRHLRTGCYDGFFSEIDLGNGRSALDLARLARQANPKVKPFFTSCAAVSRRQDPLFRQEIIFQKPFIVREVVASVKEVFG